MSNPPNPATMSQDIVDLQTQLQFQEDTIQKLDQIIIQQDDRIILLNERLRLLEDRVNEMVKEREYSASAGQEKPPHY